RGFRAIDRRTAAARSALAFTRELVAALGGDRQLSPQKRRLIDMTVRASLLLDHVDAWLFEQRSLINARSRTLLPVLVQRQTLADHVARLLDRLGLDRMPQRVQSLEQVMDAIAAQRDRVQAADDDASPELSGNAQAAIGAARHTTRTLDSSRVVGLSEAAPPPGGSPPRRSASVWPNRRTPVRRSRSPRLWTARRCLPTGFHRQNRGRCGAPWPRPSSPSR